jgi:hypothetical protein
LPSARPRGTFDPAQRKLRFELSTAALGGPVLGYSTLDGRRPQGSSVGAVLSLGVAY